MAETTGRKLIDEQARAAYTLDRHVSVTAGPGAGKTTVLVERYLHILRSFDVSIDQIVAITFTNRAASEMRERLRRELDYLAVSGPLEDRARWVRHKRRLDAAIITTIHGFCAGLLKDYPVEAGIDPEFTLLEDYQTALLEESTAEEVLTELIDSEESGIVGLAGGASRARVGSAMVQAYRSMRSLGLNVNELAAATEETHATDAQYSEALTTLELAMTQFLAQRGLSRNAEIKQREAARLWPELSRLLSSDPESVPIAEFCERVEKFRTEARPAASGDIKELAIELDGLIWEKDFGGLVPALWLDRRTKRFASALVQAVGALEGRLTLRKRQLSALDFDDLQTLVLRLLENHPEIARRATRRFRFFLVDEFQDTNELQRELMRRLALSSADANLFIVGDRKQSVYGFRGADVKVFTETTNEIESLGGASLPLHLNFRSQPALIHFFNFLFPRIFAVEVGADPAEISDLGYVEHEPSIPMRMGDDRPPLVELLVSLDQEPGAFPLSGRERDARQVAARIAELNGRNLSPNNAPTPESEAASQPRFKYGDIALLFRAMTEVTTYEAELRRFEIPYQTVQGKGFYETREISDIIQLLRFLENTTDDLALAAVLRSPLIALSDNALLALRIGPARPGTSIQRHNRQWIDAGLLSAMQRHREIEYINADDRAALERGLLFLENLISRRSRYSVSELIRLALDQPEYRVVTASTFDGAARLANIEKLCGLAEHFERSGPATIRDFVRFVRDFEHISGRESEGRIDTSADAVTLMTIHQAKGLQFPVVIIPELHRSLQSKSDWVIVDRRLGLSLKIPDGRAGLVSGYTYERLKQRARMRDRFESMRLLYVAATRTRDRLIFTGAVQDAASLESNRETWLNWIWRALALPADTENGIVELAENVSLSLAIGAAQSPGSLPDHRTTGLMTDGPTMIEVVIEADPETSFPLLAPLPRSEAGKVRATVTQLVNYRRCPRQYYFDRVLSAPPAEELTAWSDAEAPEPPANLTATLRGSVIHRFCERYEGQSDSAAILRECFESVINERRQELGGRIEEINRDKALAELQPLASNYISSQIFQRIESVREAAASSPTSPRGACGVYSEQKFRLGLKSGILFGTIDKLLVYSDAAGTRAEIIDFKTNRIVPDEKPVEKLVERAARDYTIQMQAYALAVRRLIPDATNVIATLHFLHPNIEYTLPEDLLQPVAAERTLDETLSSLGSTFDVNGFPAEPADHCGSCNFLGLCRAGWRWLAIRKLEK